MTDVTKASDEELEKLRKQFSNRSDFQGVRAKVIIDDEIDRREKKAKGGKRNGRRRV